MEENTRFYRCKKCGNVIGLIEGNAEHLVCCGEQMCKLEANTTDAASEKHVPVYEIIGNEIIVKVGDIEHPMEEDHYIMWIAQVSENRTTRIRLFPGQKPEVKFPYIPGSFLYAYCNKHSLWKSEIETHKD